MGNPEISSGFTNGKMTSNAIRGIRRKKSTLSEVRIAVIGAPGVGKSALTVRFLTKRYIGEYDHQADSKHKHEMLVDGEPVIFEIMDTTAKNPGELPPSELLQWADGFFLVFSITDRDSFTYIKRVKQQILDRKGGKDVNNSFSGPPMAIVGNKGDMVHLRQVSTEEGEILAKDGDCLFAELAAAEQVTQVADAFHELCREVHIHRKKSKQSLLDRMLGGKGNAIKVYSRGKSDSALPARD